MIGATTGKCFSFWYHMFGRSIGALNMYIRDTTGKKRSVTRADFQFFERRGGKISSGVQAAPLSELRQGLGVRVKDFHTKEEG